ncbi:hypothetical protein B0H17DRAFT_712043 [Mycena rosella]|uniref:Chromo domain-containing protein n=1 Tax=Mycena rosella TaxID=1033263 RepID=A0AAD7DA97_MYCRO|nr:hypothetical protein B0H17DRAFT_712043 [Mycena rosella]
MTRNLFLFFAATLTPEIVAMPCHLLNLECKRTRNRNTPETYPVEVILRAERTNEPIDGVFGSGWNYLIKWKGWPDKDSSWEPVSSLVGGCQRLLESFWDEIGHQNLSITVEGFPAIPRAKWVAHERQLSLQSIPAPTTPRSPKKKKNNQSPRSPTKNHLNPRTRNPQRAPA